MDRKKVKTLLILLLLVADLFLLGLWISREARDYARRRVMDAELRQLLSEMGLTVSAVLPETSAAELDVRRSPDREREAASALLGPCRAEDQGAGITQYTGGAGTAVFRATGEFEVILSAPRTLDDPESGLLELARAMGLWQGEEGTARLEPAGEGYALVIQERTPVWEGFVRFGLDGGGRLLSVSGMRLLGGETARRGPESRSAGWALLSLARSLRAEGAPPSELAGMELGYKASPLSPETVRLTPYWRVTLADAAGRARERYVNAVTGEPLGF